MKKVVSSGKFKFRRIYERKCGQIRWRGIDKERGVKAFSNTSAYIGNY